MDKKTKQEILQYIDYEGFDYYFTSKTDCSEYKDKEFHKLRAAYIKAKKDLQEFLGELEEED